MVIFRLALILLGAPSTLFAAAVSWQTCIEETTANNAELKVAQETLRASEFEAKGARNGYFPQLSADLSYSYGNGSNSQDDDTGSGEASRYRAGVSLSQNLFSGYKDQAAANRAQASFRATQMTLQSTKSKISSELKAAYAGLLFAQRSEQLQKEIIRRRDQQLKLVELRFNSGRENKGSVLLSTAYYNEARYEGLQAKNSIYLFQTQLAQILGRNEISELSIDDNLPLNPLPSDPDFKALALASPDYLKSVAEEDAAISAIVIARSGFFPTARLTADTSGSDRRWFPENDNWSVGASISFPLFDGGKDYYGTKSAVASRVAAAESKVDTDRQVVLKLRQSYYAYAEAIEKLRVDENFREAALKRAEIARSKYNNGLMTFEDWDVIEGDLIVRERAVLLGQRRLATTESEWQQAQGKGVIP